MPMKVCGGQRFTRRGVARNSRVVKRKACAARCGKSWNARFCCEVPRYRTLWTRRESRANINGGIALTRVKASPVIGAGLQSGGFRWPGEAAIIVRAASQRRGRVLVGKTIRTLETQIGVIASKGTKWKGTFELAGNRLSRLGASLLLRRKVIGP